MDLIRRCWWLAPLFFFWFSGCGSKDPKTLLAKGCEAIEGKQYQVALGHFETLLKVQPESSENADIYNLMGWTSHQLRQSAKAEAFFLKALEIEPGFMLAKYNIGCLYLKDLPERSKEGVNYLQEAVKLQPKDTRAAEMLIGWWIDRGEFTRAEGLLVRVLEGHPGSAPLHVLQARLQQLRGDGEGARIRLNRLLSQQTDYAPALFGLAYMEWNRGNAAEAGKLVTRLMATKPEAKLLARAKVWQSPKIEPVELPPIPDNPRKDPPKPPDTPDRPVPQVLTAADRIAEAGKMIAAGNRQRAQQQVMVAAAMAQASGDVKTEESARQAAVKWFPEKAVLGEQLAAFLLRQKRSSEALKVLQTVVTRSPDRLATQKKLAGLAVDLKKFTVAQKAYRAALRLSSGDADLAFTYFSVMRQVEPDWKDEAAWKAFVQRFPSHAGVTAVQQWIKELAPPENAGVWQRRADALHRKKSYGEAIVWYEKVLAEQPKNADVLYNMALAHQQLKQMDKARSYYQQCLKYNPTSVIARFNLAVIFHGEKNMAGVKQQLEILLQAKPDHGMAHYLMGQHYQSVGNHEKMKVHFSRFVALVPDHTHAKAIREWLEANP